ncbi:MAG TPA: transglycosylase domain-containing protein, partial [Candidatus Woesebacteria bacterium]|nr:transglycosylase domain-containing protein [Candidatus Woesebacteria bacterium]
MEINRKDHSLYSVAGFFSYAVAQLAGAMKKIKSINHKRFWLGFLKVVLVLLGVSIVGLIGLFVWYSRDLPAPDRIVRREGYASKVLDRNGEIIFDLYKEAKRTPVAWEEIPDALKKATIAVEDKDFYKHRGFDPLTPARIAKNFFLTGRLIGGSTLTQQLVKNVLLTSERTITRKIKEFILAVQIEARYKKDDILLMYLNEAPYGGMAWGVGSAAEQYFGKKVHDLDVAESVILAGLPQRPSVYSPFSQTPTAYIDRSKHVLERMQEDGYLTADEVSQVFEEIKNYQFYQNKSKNFAPHFVDWIKDRLIKNYGEAVMDIGGLTITTTLDLKLQGEMQTIVSDEIDKAEKQGISNGAAIAVDPRTGEVLAMI